MRRGSLSPPAGSAAVARASFRVTARSSATHRTELLRAAEDEGREDQFEQSARHGRKRWREPKKKGQEGSNKQGQAKNPIDGQTENCCKNCVPTTDGKHHRGEEQLRAKMKQAIRHKAASDQPNGRCRRQLVQWIGQRRCFWFDPKPGEQ